MEKTNEELISKAVDEILAEMEVSTDEVEKSMKGEKKEENGGEDKMKSGSPYEQKQSEKKEVKKSDDEEEKEEDEKEEEKKEDEIEKSLFSEVSIEKQELALELLKAYEAEVVEEVEEVAVEEEVSKSLEASNNDTIVKSITEEFKAVVGDLKKSLEDKDELIKSLSDKVEKLANQPSYETKGISNLETLEKSEGQEEQVIGRTQVLDRMLELQQEGKLQHASKHIAEFESTGNISNPSIKQLVMSSFN